MEESYRSIDDGIVFYNFTTNGLRTCIGKYKICSIDKIEFSTRKQIIYIYNDKPSLGRPEYDSDFKSKVRIFCKKFNKNFDGDFREEFMKEFC